MATIRPRAPRRTGPGRMYPITALILAWALAMLGTSGRAAEPTRYLRFQKGDTVAYGILEGAQVRQLSGDLFGRWAKTQTVHALKDVKLLPPTQPSQVLALAGNYRSHLQDETIPPKFQIPQPFFKSPLVPGWPGRCDRHSQGCQDRAL